MSRTAGGAGDRSLAIGLISGTSMDGIDAVVVRLDQGQPRSLASMTLPFEPELAGRLSLARAAPDEVTARELGTLDALLGDALAEAALAVTARAGLKPGEVDVIGSHGQTLLHRPEAGPGFTLQLGDAHRIAQRTGIVTVADFRRADMAAGGQGAPLAPLLHDQLLRSATETRAILNLGGIANVSLLPVDKAVTGFDTGPANCLLDEWYRRHHPGHHDQGGRWAASGTVGQAWLKQLMSDPYFLASPPKSTGIEYFSRSWLAQRLPDWADTRPADIQATLAELTAASVANAIDRWSPRPVERVIICGGGVHNDYLMERLAMHLGQVPCQSSSAHGLDPDHVESTLFAWLAVCRINNQRVDTRTITGAGRTILPGTIFAP